MSGDGRQEESNNPPNANGIPGPRKERPMQLTPARGNVSAMSLLARVTHDPAVMGGKPCLRGSRVTVGAVLGLLASGKSTEEILTLYPYLEADDIRAALEYAAWRTQETDSPLP
jgi:uncharacterized protein (DUF433 family)